MKCTLPEISWHNREPVLSVDFYPLCVDSYRLASGGGDSHVLIWHLSVDENGAVKNEVLSDLTKHQKAVNVVRWSPCGDFLASADDDANLIVWKSEPIKSDNEEIKQNWNVYKILRGHKEDIYDLCWSPNSLKILSGSIDNSAIIWEVNKGKFEKILTDHKGFVQGVSWDPKNQYMATISTDRVCRIYDSLGKQLRARISKGKLPVSEDHYLYDKEVKYFHDDTFKSFFRRLSFSPDGSLLIVPSGHILLEDCKKILNCSLVFAVETNIPAAVLPLPKQSSTVVKFCPIFFELRENGPEPVVNLPYRMVFAIGCDHDVILYDTQQMKPFARFHNIHYTRLTDLTWSPDGRLLVASSTDGYCALVSFEENEIGVRYVKEESEAEEEVLNNNKKEVEEIKENIAKDKDNIGNVISKNLEDVEVVKAETKNKASSTPKRSVLKKVPVKGNASILNFLKKPVETEKSVKINREDEKDVFEDKTKQENGDVIIIEDKPPAQINTTPSRKRITPIPVKDVTPSKSENGNKKQMTMNESVQIIAQKIESESKKLIETEFKTKKRITPIRVNDSEPAPKFLKTETETRKRITPIPVPNGKELID